MRISHAKFHFNRLTTVQDIQDYASLIFWDTVYIHFYHAMRMHSMDYAVSSVTCRFSVETGKHIIKVFLLSGSQTILVFSYQM